MKTSIAFLAAIFLMISCNKQETTLPKLQSKNLSNALTTYYFDTTYYFTTDDWASPPYDSCTNEYVALHGKINYGYLITLDDSIKIRDSSWLNYDSVYGVGSTTGIKYRYYQNIHSRQVDIWRDSLYFQIRNYFKNKILLHTVGKGNDFVVTGFIHVIADKQGTILMDSVNYNYGSCQ